MLATPCRLLLTLVALAARTPVFAEVWCSPNGDGSWTCSGDGGGSNPDQPVYTNIVGTCTNCVAMSPSECDSLKSSLKDEVSSVSDFLIFANRSLANARTEVLGLQDTIDEFWQLSEWIDMDYGDSWYVDRFLGDANQLENKKDSIISSLDQTSSSLSDIDSELGNLTILINSVNCSSCTASFDGGGGSGSGGSHTNAPSSCPDCPCKEQMEALHDLLKDDFLPRIKKIDTNVAQLTNLITIARDQLRVTKEGFHNVTNLFNRLDDYVLDDFSNRVYQIRYDVNFIASNLVQRMQRIFIDQSYSNAQFYVRQDSDTPITMKTLDETLIPEGDMSKFDWGEFENLSWFTRVEYLLLKLNGVYVSTNNSANAGVSKAEENQKSIEDGFSDFKSSVNGDIMTGFTRVGTSVSTFFSSFNSAVSSQGDKVVEIRLMSNFIGQEPLMLNIDSDVADACRTISSLLWTVLFGFLFYKIMIYFWVVFVDTINWWVNQTQGFVK